MKILHSAGVLSCLLASASLSGCATTGTGITTGSFDLATAIADAQLAAEALCAVAPTAGTITDIIIASQGGAGAASDSQTAQAAAKAFCSGIVKASARKATLFAAVGQPIDFGTITINGRVVDLRGTPVSRQ